MGFLHASEPLSWAESKKWLQYVKEHGIEQFLHTYHSVKLRQNDHLRWGDEVEYGVLRLSGCFDDPDRTVTVSLRSYEIIEELKRLEDHGVRHGLSEADRASWQPEYGAWMLESTPGKPFEGLSAILRVEENMKARRSRLLAALGPCEIIPTLTGFPMLGVNAFSNQGVNTQVLDPTSNSSTNNPISESVFLPDEYIFPHPRFRTLTANIRERRGEKVEISMPIFIDRNTDISKSKFVKADAMGFGMGCCCLQVTFQAKDVEESRHLYDQIAVLTPLMLALTAANPFLRGHLIDEDTRWNIITQSVDDRTRTERQDALRQFGTEELIAGPGQVESSIAVEEPSFNDSPADVSKILGKSRYSGFACYLSQRIAGKEKHLNNVPIPKNPEAESRLLKSGVDHLLAQHVSHLFTRDPLVMFSDRIELDDRESTDHWESLQSTNWQTVRWKPPPIGKGEKSRNDDEHIGWRVEFRSMELQMTDFENAAFVVFVVLLSRVILGLELSLYLPISMVDENMRRANKRNACIDQKFFFRKNLIPDEIAKSAHLTPNASHLTPRMRDLSNSHPYDQNKQEKPISRIPSTTQSRGTCDEDDETVEYGLMSIAEIMLGKEFLDGQCFPGLIPLCRTYLDFIGSDGVMRTKIENYLKFIQFRASGKIPTTAQWIRDFIVKHPDYQNDSVIPQTTAYDLCVAAHQIGVGKLKPESLLGEFNACVTEVPQAVNPFRHINQPGGDDNNEGREEDDVGRCCREVRSCAETAGGQNSLLLQQYLKRAIDKKVEEQATFLNEKNKQLEILQNQIDALTANLRLLKESLHTD